MNRYKQLGISLDDLKQMEPAKVEATFYPQENIRCKDISQPDFQKYYDRMMQKGNKVNLFYLWLEYKQEHPDGYQQAGTVLPLYTGGMLPFFTKLVSSADNMPQHALICLDISSL